MEKAHEKGMIIVMNPSPMDEKIFTYPLQYVDYFLLNEVEAGDTFTGFFIGGIATGQTPEKAMSHAAKAAAIAVSRPGAAPSIPWRSEL